MGNRGPLSLAICLLSACAGEITDMEEPGPAPDEECTDPQYGDGTCDPTLSCDAPDIDCFTLFSSQAEADAWFGQMEALQAQQEARAPRAIVSTTDPRFGEMRALLDQGWAAYKQVTPVGDLAGVSPALVILQDDGINAFVYGDPEHGTAAFAVVVQTGTLDALYSDDELQGLIMHELTHAIALHVVPGVKEAMRRFYVADGSEPLGFQQADDPVARGYMENWLAVAANVGQYSNAPLAGFPLNGGVDRIFIQGVAGLSAGNAVACAEPIAQFDAVRSDLDSLVSQLDTAIHLDGLETEVTNAVNGAMVDLRDVCLPGVTLDFIDVAAEINGTTPDQIRDSLGPELVAAVEDRHFIDGVWALAYSGREQMRAAESEFATAVGAPWSAARYFTTEEAADDATVPVLRAMSLDEHGQGLFLFGAQSEPTQGACETAMAAGMPPYGANLVDDHHATCWRVAHIEQLAASESGAASARRIQPTGTAPRRVVGKIPVKPLVSDYIMN